MKTKNEFYEVQKQTQKWIWFLMMFLLLMNVWAIVQQLVLGISLGPNTGPNWILFVILGVILILCAILAYAKLETRIDPIGIHFKYTPFQRNFHVIEWKDVEKVYVRVYRPIGEFGGWGMRTSFNGKNGKAYNVAGNIGLQLEMKNGKRILIGTQKGKELDEVLKSMNPLKA